MWRNLLPYRRVQWARWRLVFVLLLLTIYTELLVLKIINSLYNGTFIQGMPSGPEEVSSEKRSERGSFKLTTNSKKFWFAIYCIRLFKEMQYKALYVFQYITKTSLWLCWVYSAGEPTHTMPGSNPHRYFAIITFLITSKTGKEEINVQWRGLIKACCSLVIRLTRYEWMVNPQNGSD